MIPGSIERMSIEKNRLGDEAIAGRRPLKSRQWPVFEKLAAWLASTSITPNTISVFSMLFGAMAGICFAATRWLGEYASGNLILIAALYLSAALFMQLRLVANLLDGMVAVEGGKRSAVGVLYNEVPDRVADAFILVGAGYSWMVRPELGLLAAVVAVFVAYVRAIGASAGAGEMFDGPMAKQQRMALMAAAAIICAVLCVSQLGFSGIWPSRIITGSLVIVAFGGIITAIRRLLRIAKRLRTIADGSKAADGSKTADGSHQLMKSS